MEFKLQTFKNMTDEERLSIIDDKLNKAIEFKKSIEGTGRTYDASVKLSIEQLEWLISKVK